MVAKRRHLVAAVVSGEVAPFELAVACEVFGIDRSDLGVPWYRFMVCAAEPTPLSRLESPAAKTCGAP